MAGPQCLSVANRLVGYHGNQTYTIAAADFGCLLVFQMDPGSVLTIVWPAVTSRSDFTPIGFRNNTPTCTMRHVAATGNTINGWSGDFNQCGDEALVFAPDIQSESNWLTVPCGVRYRQPPYINSLSTTFNTISSSYVNVTGFSAKLSEKLQQVGSIEEITVDVDVGMSNAGRFALTLNNGTSDVHAAGTYGLATGYVPDPCATAHVSFTYKQPGGIMRSNTDPTLWQLRAKVIGAGGQTLWVGRSATDGTPSDTRIIVRESAIS